MKRTIATILLATSMAITTANTPTATVEPADFLLGLAARIATPIDLIITTCPEIDVIAACLVGTGSKDLDKNLLDYHMPNLGFTWVSPWLQPGPLAFGRAFDTAIGNVHVMIFEVGSYDTLIVLWVP